MATVRQKFSRYSRRYVVPIILVILVSIPTWFISTCIDKCWDNNTLPFCLKHCLLGADLEFEMLYIRISPFEPSPSLLKSGDTLRSGDYYRLTWIPRQKSHVYIFQVTNSKEIYPLFPISDFQGVPLEHSNPLKAGKFYGTPSMSQWFALDEQSGNEAFYFLATLDQDSQLEQHIKVLQTALEKNDPEQVQVAQDNLRQIFEAKQEVSLTKPLDKRQKIQANRKDFELPLQLLSVCDECVYKLNFTHQ